MVEGGCTVGVDKMTAEAQGKAGFSLPHAAAPQPTASAFDRMTADTQGKAVSSPPQGALCGVILRLAAERRSERGSHRR